jgi:hypothetical protein
MHVIRQLPERRLGRWISVAVIVISGLQTGPYISVARTWSDHDRQIHHPPARIAQTVHPDKSDEPGHPIEPKGRLPELREGAEPAEPEEGEYGGSRRDDAGDIELMGVRPGSRAAEPGGGDDRYERDDR